MIYRARKQQLGYGRPIGILALEERIPCPPGTPGNPTTFTHPVCYEVVRGIAASDLADPANSAAFRALAEAAGTLVERGVRAIVGACGLMIMHQAALAEAVPVPVLTSSLLQLPLIAAMLGPRTPIGVIASSRNSLKPEHLRLASAGVDIPVALATMDGRDHFRAAICDECGELDYEKVESEVVQVARDLMARTPGLRAILLECVDLPPYAAAIQQAVDLPVFDITTLVEHMVSALVRRPFAGVY